MIQNHKKPIIEFDGKSYEFAIPQMIVLIIGIPLLSFLIFLSLKLRINYWIYEFTANQIVFFLNSIFSMNSYIIIDSQHNIFPTIFIPNHPSEGNYAITPNCIAAQVFSIIISIIICIPSSTTSSRKKDFMLRKIKSLIFIILFLYIINIFRIVFLLFLNYNGIPFDFIHQSLFVLSAIVGALIFIILVQKWVPEFFFSIYYFYYLIFKSKKTNI